MNNYSNRVAATIELMKRTAIVAVVTIVVMSAAIVGFFRFDDSFPTNVSANTVFSEEILSGINEPTAVSDEQNNIEVYRAVAPGVALISTGGERGDFWGEPDEGSGTGSGVVIAKSGHILTNEHVIRAARNLTVNLGGDKVFPARLVGADPDTDLAVIKISAPAEQLTVVPVGDSDAVTGIFCCAKQMTER